MHHGISSNDWEGYLEDRLPAAERDRLDAHLIGCAPCWEFHQRLAALNAQLHEAGVLTRDRFSLSDETLHAGLRNVFARIHGHHDAAPSNPVQQRLDELAAVMTVICGAEVAAQALQTAAQRSAARSLQEITRENWESFLQRLSAIAHVLFGRTGAHLVLESGRF
jgi:hypothetical protein